MPLGAEMQSALAVMTGRPLPSLFLCAVGEEPSSGEGPLSVRGESVLGPLLSADGMETVAQAALVIQRGNLATVVLLEPSGSLRPFPVKDVQGLSMADLASKVAASAPEAFRRHRRQAVKKPLSSNVRLPMREIFRSHEAHLLAATPKAGDADSMQIFLETGTRSPRFVFDGGLPLFSEEEDGLIVSAPQAGNFNALEAQDGSLSLRIPGVAKLLILGAEEPVRILGEENRWVEAGEGLFIVSDGFRERLVVQLRDPDLLTEWNRLAMERVQEASKPFLELLDPEILAASKTEAGMPVALYNCLLAGGDALLSKRRVQAAHALGHLKTELLAPSPILAAVDAAEPLYPAMKRHHPLLTKPIFRLLTRTPPSFYSFKVGADPALSLFGVVSALSSVRPEKFPGRGPVPAKESWRGFVLAWTSLARFSERCRLRPEELMGREPAAWLDSTAPRDLDVDSMADAVLSFRRHILIPIALDVLDPPPSMESKTIQTRVAMALGESGCGGESVLGIALLRDKTLRRLEALASRWHRHGDEVEAALSNEGILPEPLRRWPALTPDWPAPNGLVIRALCSAEALAAESVRMRNCLGRGLHQAACLYSTAHILTIETPDGGAVSTAEIKLLEDPLSFHKLTVAQHYGPRNSPPPSEAVAALSSWMAAVEEGKLVLDRVSIFTALSERLSIRKGITGISMVDYDSTDPAARQAMFKAYAFMLPHGERGVGHAEWAEKSGALPAVRRNVDAAASLWNGGRNGGMGRHP